jgi:hypothetical protein
MKGLAPTVVLVACLLSGCADRAGEANEGSSQPNPSAGGVTVLVSESSGPGMEALGGGRLEILSGCLGASGSVIVWPNGTEIVKGEPLTINIPTYGTFALGDKVRVAGGFVLEHSSDEVEPGGYQAGGVTVPAACAKHDIFVAH